jgi:hypothetical protein
MAYNPFPIGYQPYYQANYQPVQNPPQNQNTGIIWVSGEAGARGYPVAPNTTIQLWDSEAQIVYLKSADASGMPSMKILDYTIRDNPSQGNALQKQPQIDLSGYVTKEEFEKRISEVIGRKVTVDE